MGNPINNIIIYIKSIEINDHIHPCKLYKQTFIKRQNIFKIKLNLLYYKYHINNHSNYVTFVKKMLINKIICIATIINFVGT